MHLHHRSCPSGGSDRGVRWDEWWLSSLFSRSLSGWYRLNWLRRCWCRGWGGGRRRAAGGQRDLAQRPCGCGWCWRGGRSSRPRRPRRGGSRCCRRGGGARRADPARLAPRLLPLVPYPRYPRRPPPAPVPALGGESLDVLWPVAVDGHFRGTQARRGQPAEAAPLLHQADAAPQALGDLGDREEIATGVIKHVGQSIAGTNCCAGQHQSYTFRVANAEMRVKGAAAVPFRARQVPPRAGRFCVGAR